MPSRTPRLAVRSLTALRRSVVFVLAVLIVLVAGSAVAQSAPCDSSEERTDEECEPSDPPPSAPVLREVVVVSANRLEAPASTVGSSVTVLDRETIERRRKLTVSELLRMVPGVEVTQTGGLGKATSIRVRGGDASQALVLVDGLRANSTTTGDFDFGQLLAENLERIEVLRGPQAIYGSEAVSGVISIVTRRGRGRPGGSLEGEAGTHDLSRIAASTSGGRGPFDFSASLSDLRTDGVSHLSERERDLEDDGYDNTTLSGRFGFAPSAASRLDLTLRSSDGDSEVDGFLVDDPNAHNRTKALQAGLALEAQVAPSWRQTVRLGVTDNDLEGFDPDTPFNNFRIESRTELLQLQSDVDLAESDTLSFGFDWEERTAHNVGSFEERVRLRSAFVQNLWTYRDRLFLTGAVRRDEHSRFGDETTVRATAALLFPGADVRAHGSYGTGFRAPDLNELYFPGAGDPRLRPERSEGWDAGVERAFWAGRGRVDLTLFSIDFEDLIDFDLVEFRFGNVAAARSEGVELAVDLRPARWSSLVLTHTFNDTEDRASGRALPRRPRQRSTLVLSLDPTARVRGTLSLLVVRDRVNSDGRPMDDYERLDLGLDVEVRTWIRPYVRIENVLDAEYEEVTGFTTPGRTAALGLRLTLAGRR